MTKLNKTKVAIAGAALAAPVALTMAAAPMKVEANNYHDPEYTHEGIETPSGKRVGEPAQPNFPKAAIDAVGKKKNGKGADTYMEFCGSQC